MKLQIESWFAVPIWQVNLGLTEEELNCAKNLCLDFESKNKGRVLSNYGGWQSNDLNEQDLKILGLNFIQTVVKDYAQMCIKEFGSSKILSIGNVWININRRGDFNKPHTHPRTNLVAVTYLTDSVSAIVFKRPQDVFSYFLDEIESNNNTQNSFSIVSYKPSKNTVLIFPAWLVHETELHNSDDPRISVSANFRIN